MSSDNVIPFRGYTKLDIDPDAVLDSAIGAVDPVLVIGDDNDGELYIASSTADKGKILFLLERARFFLLLNT